MLLLDSDEARVAIQGGRLEDFALPERLAGRLLHGVARERLLTRVEPEAGGQGPVLHPIGRISELRIMVPSWSGAVLRDRVVDRSLEPRYVGHHTQQASSHRPSTVISRLTAPDRTPCTSSARSERWICVPPTGARPHGFQRRERIASFFWPESDAERSRHSLRQALHAIRTSLGENALETRGDDEVALSTAHVWCDAVELDLAFDEQRCDVVELHRGSLLDGFYVGRRP